MLLYLLTCLLRLLSLAAGYSTIDAVGQPYPVVYLNDGQNLFGDCPTMSGQHSIAHHMYMHATK